MNTVSSQFWDSIADEWRKRRTPGDDQVARVIDSLGCAPGSLILDAGCGTGSLSLPLAMRGYRVRGIDLAPRMIANAREAAHAAGLAEEMAEFAVGDVERIAFADETFDAVLCALVLDFTPRPGVALAAFRRVLKPGGRLLLLTLGAHSPVKHEWWRRFLPDNTEERVRNYILPWEMEALLGALGWQIIAQEPSFGRSFDGTLPQYTAEIREHVTDPVLLQTVATAWAFTAVKPA